MTSLGPGAEEGLLRGFADQICRVGWCNARDVNSIYSVELSTGVLYARRYYIQGVLYTRGIICKGYYIQGVLYTRGIIYKGYYMQGVLYAGGIICKGYYIRRFLGFANYVQQFISHFPTKVSALTNMLKGQEDKKRKFIWLQDR